MVTLRDRGACATPFPRPLIFTPPDAPPAMELQVSPTPTRSTSHSRPGPSADTAIPPDVVLDYDQFGGVIGLTVEHANNAPISTVLSHKRVSSS